MTDSASPTSTPGERAREIVKYWDSIWKHLESAIAQALARERREENEAHKPLADAAEFLWAVVANVSGGDWTKQSAEWQEAAARGRDDYFAAARKTSGQGEGT